MASMSGDSYHVIDENDQNEIDDDGVDEDEDDEDDVCRPSYTDDCDQLENPDGVSCNQGDQYRKIDGRYNHIYDVIDVNDAIHVDQV